MLIFAPSMQDIVKKYLFVRTLAEIICMKKGTFFLIFLLRTVILIAQHFPFTRYGVYEGLRQSQVTCLALDVKNRVIIGTKDGLSIFDGIEMKTIEDPMLDNTEVAKQVSCIYPTQNGFYACLGGGVIIKYNLQSQKMEKKWSNHEKKSNLRPWQLTIDEEGRVLVIMMASPVKGQKRLIYRFDETIQQLIRYDSLSNPDIEGIAQWKLDTASKAIIFRDEKGKVWAYRNKRLSPLALPAPSQVLYQQTPQSPMYCFAGEGVYRLQNSKWIHLYDIPKPTILSRNIMSQDIAIDANENAYYKVYNAQKKLFEIKKYDKKQEIGTGFFHSNIGGNLLIKDQKHLCIPTETGFYYNSTQAFTLYDESTEGMLPDIWNILEDKKGNIKLASYGHGLATLDNQTQKITKDEGYLSLLPADERIYPSFYMGGIRAKNGDNYFSLSGSGVVKYDGKRYDTLAYQGTKERGRFFMSMYEDESKMYFGGREKLFIYDKKLQKITDCKQIALRGKGLGGYVTDIEKDKNGNLWMGGRKLAVWNTKSDSIQKLYGNDEEYPIKGAMSIHKDYKGNMWVGGLDGGLAIYDYQGFKLVAADRIKRQILSIIDIDSSYLLLGCIEGLYLLDLQRFYKKQETWLYFFDKNNGYLIEESGQNAFYKEVSCENIWLPASKGVAKMDVAELKREMQGNYLATGIFNITKGVKRGTIYAYENENLNLNLKNKGHQIVYEYTIEYESGAKIQNTTRDTLLLVPLRQGACKITLKVKLATGLTQGDNFVLQFRVKPYFWKTTWGLALIIAYFIAMVAGVLYFYYRYQSKKEQLQAQIALGKEKESTFRKELARKMAEFKSVTAELNTHLFTLENHFVLNYLNSAIRWHIKEEGRDDALDSVAMFAAFLEKNVLDEKGAFWQIEKEISFVKEYVALENRRWQNKISYSSEIQPNIDNKTLVPKGIIQNYVSNSIKHGYDFAKLDAYIFVRISRNKDVLLIEIEDDGKGINVENIHKGEEHGEPKSTHKGIQLVEAIFAYLNQLNEVQSTQVFQNKAAISPDRKGTLVTITLPYHLRTEYRDDEL